MSTRRGFTLIEVTIALVVGGMALSAAVALFTGLGERADQIRAAGARVDRDANAERLLRSLWTNLRPSDDSSPIVSGDSTVVEFSAWCESVEGWLRPCRARLAIDHDGRGSQFTLVLAAAATMTMKFWHRDHGLERIRYLRNAENGGHLVTNWRDIVPPLAIVVIAGTDTVMFPTWR